MKKIIVLASGRGSNFQAIVKKIQDRYIPARCVGLITDNPKASVIDIAKNADIPVFIIDYATFPDKTVYEAELITLMKELSPDFIVLAGYMRLLGDTIVQRFHDKILNIHPALLPSFPGLHAQEQAIAYGVKIAGCTVHYVTEEMDGGPVIIQRVVPVLDDDDSEQLSARILLEEHIAFPEALKLVCEGRIEKRGRIVKIKGQG